MRYIDFEDCDNDMLSMEDWDNICDAAMEHSMRMRAYSDWDDTPNPISMKWGEDEEDEEDEW